MVKLTRGQSTMEFLVVLAALTIVGLILSYVIHPWQGGAISGAQDSSTNAIAND